MREADADTLGGATSPQDVQPGTLETVVAPGVPPSRPASALDTVDAGSVEREPLDTAATVGAGQLASSAPAAPRQAVAQGTVIGRYVAVSKLGAGGMGEVWAAYDPELDRKVAIKLIRSRSAASEAARERLRREAQALAKLAHPAVIGVHDVGMHAGQLFVAMEFVEGQTLGAWMKASEGPRPWREVLERFIEAGRGLEAAHAAGLIHRDFKPDNVILGADGRVRVIDFGLARADGEVDEQAKAGPSGPRAALASSRLSTQLTRTGAMMGTPAYMPHEQFEGRGVDARSDQWSFCAALHEALYAQLPFEGTTIGELVYAVVEGEVRPAPSDTEVPSWLRGVVLRGLEREPAARWPSMQALLDALADDPIARRRRRLTRAGLGLAVAGLLGAAYVASAGEAEPCTGMDAKLAGVWDDARRSEVSTAFASTGLGHARQVDTRVQAELDRYLGEWVEMRTEACEVHERGEQSARLLDLRMVCLDERLNHVRATVELFAVADETALNEAVQAVLELPRLERCADAEALEAAIPPPEDPQVAARVEALEAELVEVEAQTRLGAYNPALERARTLRAEAEELGYAPLVVRARLREGKLEYYTSEHDAAVRSLEQTYVEALALLMVPEAASASATLAKVVARELTDFDAARRWSLDAEPLARAEGSAEARGRYHASAGMVEFEAGNFAVAREHYERALALYEEVHGVHHPSVARVHMDIGGLAREQGRFDEAEAAFKRALAVLEDTLGSEHPDVASVLNNLGSVAEDHARFDEAQAYLERARDIRIRSLGPNHPDTANSISLLGSLAYERGDTARARELLEQALALRTAHYGANHATSANDINNLAVVQMELGEYEAARDSWREVLDIWEREFGPAHANVGVVLANLGVAEGTLGNLELAHELLVRALAVREKSLGPDHPDVATTLGSLASNLRERGELDEAWALLQRARRIREQAFELDHPELGGTLVSLGDVAYARKDYAQARELYEACLANWESSLGPEHRFLVFPLFGLAEVERDSKQLGKALLYLERAVAIGKRDQDPSTLAEVQFVYAQTLWDVARDQGRDRERARIEAREALAIWRESDPESAAEVEAWLRDK